MQTDYIDHLASIQGGKCSLPWCGCGLNDTSVGGVEKGFVSVQRILVRDHVDLGDNLPVFEAFPSPWLFACYPYCSPCAMAISRHVQLVHTTGHKTLCNTKKGNSNKDHNEGTDENDAARKKYESLMLGTHPVEFPIKISQPQSWRATREFGH